MTCSQDIRGMNPTVACRIGGKREPGGIAAADVEGPAEGERRPADCDGAGDGVYGGAAVKGREHPCLLQVVDA